MKKRKTLQLFAIVFFVFLSWNGYLNLSENGNNKYSFKLSTYLNNSEFQLFDAKIDGEYCIFPNVFNANNTEEERITLILHSSYDRIQKSLIEKHINNWQAPISLSVVFPRYSSPYSGNVQCVYKIFKDLYESNNLIFEYLSVHFIIPKADICHSIKAGPLPTDKQCNRLKEEEKEILKHLSPSTKMEREVIKLAEYPVNFARNFARKQSITNYILIADMDHMFSQKFEYKMRQLASKILMNGTKTVLVYRIFEINETSKWPKTKDNLKILLLNNEAMEFHSSFSLAHKIPYLDRWLDRDRNDDENITEIQYYHRFKKFAWEPQFVSRTDIPFHDETFSYPLRDNTVLRWELCRAEYRFAVIYDVFMFHPGIKTAEYQKKHNIVRSRILPYKKQALEDFRFRMNETYPETKNKCPKFYF